MAASEKDVVPILSATDSQTDESDGNRYHRRFSSRARSASLPIPANSMESYYTENALLGFTGPLRNERRTPLVQMSGPLYGGHKPESNLRPSQVTLGHKSTGLTMEKYPSVAGRESNGWANDDYFGKNEHLLRSGQLGMCNDPYCTTCPAIDILNAQKKKSKPSEIYDHKFHNMIYGDAKGCAKKICSFLSSRIPGVMNPHTKVVQRWNKFFAISCLFAVFIDPLFLFLLTVNKDNKCIVLNWPLTTTIVILRSFTDFIYLINMLLQFRLAYVNPESRVVGAGDLVDHPKKIALHYLKGYFLVDFFIILPFPQIIILLILPRSMRSGANFAKNLLRTAILVQYVPRLFRLLPLIAGQSSSGFIFESAWANFVINLTFVLAGHVVGSCWYLFGLQRVNQCLRDACHDSKIENCRRFIDCGHSYSAREFSNYPSWSNWTTNVNATACFDKDYKDGYYGIYGQAVNLTTKHSIVTRYVYSLQLEMSLRRRDVEQWMSHRRLSDDLRRRVREAERYTWEVTRGVNEERLLEDLPEDIQRDIRRHHLFRFVKRLHIFALLDDPILDAICERLRQKTYIQGSRVLYQGGLIDKMVFITRGMMESIGENGNFILSEGDACGEELLTWCIEHSSVNKGHRLLSNRGVECLTNVEAFILRAADIEEVTSRFAKFFRSPRVQGAIRYASPYWRDRAARCIQVAWRHRKKRQSRADSARPQHSVRNKNLLRSSTCRL
nr:probable cyclic nucleotide-gated ion channel 20, chloroplastic isoform X3 [Ipomoea trifida]